jgi:16S rRNA (guanine(527)-N(7))-methyltransferase RsmG
MSSEFRRALEREVLPYVPLNTDQIEALERHWELLLRWNSTINLTTRTDPNEAAIRHYGESLFLASHITGKRIADVGSGPGFPGIPIAIARSDWEVTLVESDKRKVVFLREASAMLQNVKVYQGRHNSLRGKCDWVVSRAVRPQDAVEAAILLSARIAVIASGHPDSSKVAWNQSIALPWPGSGRVLFGSVSPGTSSLR